VCLLEQVRDGPPQFVSFGSARGHALGCGNKGDTFQGDDEPLAIVGALEPDRCANGIRSRVPSNRRGKA
jgi:hypothetical protein